MHLLPEIKVIINVYINQWIDINTLVSHVEELENLLDVYEVVHLELY
jgi:hypothetical protein